MRCEKCGQDYNGALGRCPNCGASAQLGGKTEFYGKAAASKIGIGDFFNGVFAKHPKGTGVKLFMSGTPTTTPTPDTMLAQWQKPWLFFRMLCIGIIFTLLCGVMIYMQQSAGYVTLWTIGSLIIPLTILTFYWEINIPRDIPIYTVIGVFFIGGVISLVITMLMSQIISSEYAQFAWFAPVYEEPAKLLAAVIFIKKLNVKYGFGGLLMGGAVGAGFAAFENIMYVINYYSEGAFQLGAAAATGDYSQVADPTAMAMEVFILRALLSFGGHTIWAAIYCGPLVLAKGNAPLTINHFGNTKFLIYFGASFGLHFLWNANPIGIWFNVVLTVVGIIVLFSVIKTCLTQVVQTAELARFNPNIPPVGSNPYTAPPPVQPVQSVQPPMQPIQSVQPPMQPIQSAQPPYAQQQMPKPQAAPIAQNPSATPTVALASSAQLIAISGPLQGAVYDFKSELTIGRDPAQCNVIFPIDAVGISRKHCSLRVTGNTIYITDHGSSSGTFLSSGQRITSGQWIPVNGTFYLGSTQNTFSANMK